MRILLVEDDRILGDGIASGLRQDGFAIDWINSGNEALPAINAVDYDLLLLDLGLPGKDGLDIIREIRKQGNVIPILVLTARDTIDDRVTGLDTGADDYLVKPFDLNELSARLRALTRRSFGQTDPEIRFGDIVMKPSSHQVFFKGEQIDLLPKEYAVLDTLLKNPGKIVSKSKLQENIYSWDENVESNTMEVHIHHLRKKLSKDVIRTIRGVGYMIEKTEQ